MYCTVVHVVVPSFVEFREILEFWCAVSVALFNKTCVEYIFDNAATGQTGLFDDDIIIRGIVIVVIVCWFVFVGGRLSILLACWLATVLGDHVGKT